MNIDSTLNERGARYGDYAAVAGITQSIMQIIESGASYEQMNAAQKTSLFMIANKLARIVNGDPSYQDSWHDISGYATLVVNELENIPVTPQVILDAVAVKCSEKASCEHVFLSSISDSSKCIKCGVVKREIKQCEHKTENGCVGCVKWGESK